MTKWRLAKILLIPNAFDVLGNHFVGHVRQDVRIVGKLVFQCHVRVDVRQNRLGLFAGLSVDCFLQAAFGNETVNEITVETLRDFFMVEILRLFSLSSILAMRGWESPTRSASCLAVIPRAWRTAEIHPCLGGWASRSWARFPVLWASALSKISLLFIE